ncbi:MAG: NTP transferase domain-containing protein [Lachnospiraceae bacterium]|nr:NTP transferase domain-containing protein [Lachnospiraceae bacterium]
MKVDNAIIMAAGTSSRFAPLSYEQHKAMTVVKGEVLIERQIRQLQAAGVPEIYIVTGYKADQFEYLTGKYGIRLLHNPEYLTRNNHSSIWAAREVLGNSYVCSSDNYFAQNPFEKEVDEAYYAAEYADGPTAEWCMTEDENGYINSVTIGGEKAWYMLGHTFWSRDFSSAFLNILEKEYNLPETTGKLWEKIFLAHLDVLKMKIRKYAPGVIYEFDTLDELREFDESYRTDTRSALIKEAAGQLKVKEQDILHIKSLQSQTTAAAGFEFDCPAGHYRYLYDTKNLVQII